jgi:hypothetical protein
LAGLLKRRAAPGIMLDQWQAIPRLPDTEPGVLLAA